MQLTIFTFKNELKRARRRILADIENEKTLEYDVNYSIRWGITYFTYLFFVCRRIYF